MHKFFWGILLRTLRLRLLQRWNLRSKWVWIQSATYPRNSGHYLHPHFLVRPFEEQWNCLSTRVCHSRVLFRFKPTWWSEFCSRWRLFPKFCSFSHIWRRHGGIKHGWSRCFHVGSCRKLYRNQDLSIRRQSFPCHAHSHTYPKSHARSHPNTNAKQSRPH